MGLRCPNPQCGVPASEGEAYCAACGCDLASAPPPALPAAPDPKPAVSAAAENAETLRLDELLKGKTTGSSSSGPGFFDASKPEEEPASQFFDDCPDFKVEHDAGRIFVEGQTFPFQIRLIPLREDIDDLFIEIRHAITGQLVGRDEPDEMLHKGRRLTIPIPFRPTTGISGKIAFDFYIGYTMQGQKVFYKARHSNTVFPAKEQAQSIIRDLKIEYHNTISQGHAGDMQLDQRLQDLNALRPHSDDSAEEIIKRLDFPPIWKPLGLCRCRYNHHHEMRPASRPTPASAPAAARVPRLVLETKTRTVFVYSDSRLVAGRKSKCDIVTYVRDAHGRADLATVGMISRYHCQIEATGPDCVVIDKAWNPDERMIKNSAEGTFIDGTKIRPSGGTAKLPVDRSFTLSLSGPSIAEDGSFGFSGRLYSAARVLGECKGCTRENDSQALAGLVLKDQRCDRETWTLVWKALPLAALDPSWGEGCLCRCGEGFLVRVENRFEWLMPGRTLNLPGLTLQVKPFEKGCI